MSLDLRKGTERSSRTMVTGAAAGAYMLVGMIVSTGTFGGCELKCEANGSVVVATEEFAILGSRKSLLAFLRRLLVADQVFMSGAEAYDGGRRETVVSKGLGRGLIAGPTLSN